MADLFDGRLVPLHEQLRAAEREVRLRRRVYPTRVANGRMKAGEAEREVAAMVAIVATLAELVELERVRGAA